MKYIDLITGREYVPQMWDALNWHWQTAVPGWVIAEVETLAGGEQTADSHTSGIVICEDGGILSVGAEASGIVPTPLDDILADPANVIKVLRPNFNYGPDAPPEGWEKAIRDRVLGDVMRNTIRYGYDMLLADVWRLNFPDLGDDPPDFPNEVICAMYWILVARKYRNWRGCPGIQAISLSPGDLAYAAARGAWLKVECNQLTRVE